MKRFLFYLVQFTWGIVQNIMGLVAFLALYRGRKHEKFHNAIITYVDKKGFGGLSLGIFIFINAKRDGEWLHDTQIHEYGHTIQSNILGPVWPFVIALPSVIWCNVLDKYRKKNNISYYKLYCEGWANMCGLWATKDKFQSKECIERGRYGKPIEK